MVHLRLFNLYKNLFLIWRWYQNVRGYIDISNKKPILSKLWVAFKISQQYTEGRSEIAFLHKMRTVTHNIVS